MILYCSAQVL